MTRLERILIPLDGSRSSEHALRLAAAIRQGGSEATLVQVVGSEAEASRASAYLERVAEATEGRFSAKVLVQRASDPGPPIRTEAELAGHDLVVLMTRKEKGIKGCLRGSVAEHVLRRSSVPLLLGNPQGANFPAGIRKVLVPMGGDESAEEVLPLVQKLCLSTGAEALLFSVVWSEPNDNTPAYVRDLSAANVATRRALDAHALALERAGVKASALVHVGFPAGAIVHVAEKLGVDLIAMATHRRSGLKRWLFGSVAEEVARSSLKPLLLVRARGAAAAAGLGAAN